MKSTPTILLIGTADTKADELSYIRNAIVRGGGRVMLMDVGVLGTSDIETTINSHVVAQAAGTQLSDIVNLGDENAAMTLMAMGATRLTQELQRTDTIQGVLILGGTMGTDLSLDVTVALPIGFPKLVLSTVAFSHLIPPERLAPDLLMMLWAGGLYGLNSICKKILTQASGAILGACQAKYEQAHALLTHRPKVAISSLGKSALSYMVTLKPELEERGFEVVVFHCTGMGGQAMESLITQGEFVCVLDLCLQEVGNHIHGSVVSSGAHRLESAGKLGIPQIVAPGALDLIDVQAWAELPPAQAGRPLHVHNRLIASLVMTQEERIAAAKTVIYKLIQAKGATALVLPLQGIEAWDRLGQALYDPTGLASCLDTLESELSTITNKVQLHKINAHINDAVFCDTVLMIFDDWVKAGIISTSVVSGSIT